MLIFLAILASLAVIAEAASTDAPQAFFQKGKNTMQQQNPALRAESGNLPSLDALAPVRVETFTFGLGWFWGIEARFGVLKGVVRTRVGYAGGAKKHPTYRSLGDHTETVQVDFDPTVISYGELLEVFWASHDPARPAWSRQYMNVIFTHNDEQKRLAEESKDRVGAKLGKPVQTALLPATLFTLAEDYHQKYYLRQAPGLWEEISRAYPKLDDLVNSRAAARLNGYVAGLGSPAQLEEELAGLGLSPETGRQLLAWVTAKSGQGQGCPVPK